MAYLQIYKTDVPNANRTLRIAVSAEYISNKINNSYVKQKIQKLSGKLFLWDFTENCTSKMTNKIGETVVIVMKSRVFVGEIIEYINDPRAEIYEAVGWAPIFGKPWFNVIFFRNGITYALSNEALGSIQQLTTFPPDICDNNLFYLNEEEEVEELMSIIEGLSEEPTYVPRKEDDEIIKKLKNLSPDKLKEILDSISE